MIYLRVKELWNHLFFIENLAFVYVLPAFAQQKHIKRKGFLRRNIKKYVCLHISKAFITQVLLVSGVTAKGWLVSG